MIQRLKFVSNCCDELYVVFVTTWSGHIVESVLNEHPQAQPGGQAGFDTEFSIEHEVLEIGDFRQKFDGLPNLDPIIKLVVEPFGQPEGGIIIVIVAHALKNIARTKFTTEARVRVFDEVITGTRAEGVAEMDVSYGIVDGIATQIAEPVVAKEAVVLDVTAEFFGTGGSVVFTIVAACAKAEFVLGPLTGRLEIADQIHGFAVSPGESEAHGRAAVPLDGRGCWGSGIRCLREATCG